MFANPKLARTEASRLRNAIVLTSAILPENQKNMNKFFVALGIVIAVIVGYWLISPLFIEKKVSERLEDIGMLSVAEKPAAPETLAKGKFTGLLGHNAEGTAALVKAGGKYFIRLEDDFRVTNGPDLFVYFGKDGEYSAEARLGSLKGNSGGQNYEVPPGINPLQYNEVWVWCRAFSVAFGKAELK